MQECQARRHGLHKIERLQHVQGLRLQIVGERTLKSKQGIHSNHRVTGGRESRPSSAKPSCAVRNF